MVLLVFLNITYFGLNPLLNVCNILLQIKYWLLICIQNKLDNFIIQSFYLIVHINPNVVNPGEGVSTHEDYIICFGHLSSGCQYKPDSLTLVSVVDTQIYQTIYFLRGLFYICVLYQIETTFFRRLRNMLVLVKNCWEYF